MATGNAPDYDIRALDKTTGEKGRIGVGYKNPDGSISLVFNRFAAVPVGKNFAIRAFAWRPFGGKGYGAPFSDDGHDTASDLQSSGSVADDDIPF